MAELAEEEEGWAREEEEVGGERGEGREGLAEAVMVE